MNPKITILIYTKLQVRSITENQKMSSFTQNTQDTQNTQNMQNTQSQSVGRSSGLPPVPEDNVVVMSGNDGKEYPKPKKVDAKNIKAGIELMIKKVADELREEYLKEELLQDAKKIDELSELLNKLDSKMKSLDEETNLIDVESDGKEESKQDYKISITKENFGKVRWSYDRGEKTAKGMVRLNHKSLSATSNKKLSVFVAVDISNSMKDTPLVELSKEMIAFITNLVEMESNVELSVCVYGRHATLILDDEILNAKTYSKISEVIKKNIGTPTDEHGNCTMGGGKGIRGGTNFKHPLRLMFSKLSSCKKGEKRGVGIWYSDGKEWVGPSNPETDIREEVDNAFTEGLGGLDVDICTAAYGYECGEGTKMQQMAGLWEDECPNGSGFYTSADNIKGLANFAYQSILPRLMEPIATDISVILPASDKDTQTEHDFKKITENPIDIAFELPVSTKLRVGATTNFEFDKKYDDIVVEFTDINGEHREFNYALLDRIQLRGGCLENSVETKTAHILKEINEIVTNKITGLPSKAKDELEYNKKCLELLNSIGKWNGDNWEPQMKKQGGVLRPIAAKHQIPNKNQFEVIKSSIVAAEMLLQGGPMCPELLRSATQVYQDASISMECLTRGQSKGDTQRDGYDRRLSNYGAALN